MRVVFIIVFACVTIAACFIFANKTTEKVQVNQSANSEDSIPIGGKITDSRIFNSYSIIKPDNNGVSVKKVIRTVVSVSISDKKRQMEFDLNMSTGKVKFYWLEIVEQKLENYGPLIKGIKYTGVDDSGKYAEVELFYNKKNSLEMLVIRTDNNTTAISLMDIPASNTKKGSESSSMGEKEFLIGEWYVIHQAFINFEFRQDGTFTMQDANNNKIVGEYTVKGLNVTLYVPGRQNEVLIISRHPMDGKNRFKYRNLEYICGKQLTE